MGLMLPLSLSPSDATQLQVITKEILNANLDRYQIFYDVENSNVDPTTWKQVKTKDKLSAYIQRQRKQGLQKLLCIGSVLGTLDNVMSRLINPNGKCWIGLSRSVILSTIRESTSRAPFKSLAVKRIELDVRFKSMGLVKNHDYVCVEATGTLQLPSGARIGYHLLHSVDFPQAKSTPGRIRGKLSVCSFFRQESEAAVSVYTLGMMDSVNDRTRRTIMPRFTKSLLESLDCIGKINGNVVTNSMQNGLGNPCAICSKRILQLGKFVTRSGTCSVCSRHVCRSCKVEKKVRLVAADLKVTQRKVTFCTPSACMANATASRVAEASFAEHSRSVAGFCESRFLSVWQSTPVPGNASSSVSW